MTSARRRLTHHPIISIVLLGAAVILYSWTNIWNAWHSINNNDFKHIYFGMKALLDGISPYTFDALHHQAALQGFSRISLNPYVYLPFTGQAMAFLAPLRLEQAVIAWFCLNHIFVVISLWLISVLWSGRRLLAFALLLLAMAINFPLYRTLTAGQLNCALLLLICISWRLMRSGRPAIAGATIAIATLYKLMPGIYVILFLMQRRWRALFSMAIADTALFAISALFAGLPILLDFVPVLRQMGYGKSTWPAVFSFWNDPSNQSLNSFFSHIFTLNGHTIPWVQWGQKTANLFTIVTTLLVILTYCYVMWARRRRRPTNDVQFTFCDDHTWGATLTLGLLIPSLLWDHYLVMLIFPVALILRSAPVRHWASGLAILCWLLISTPWHFENPAWTHGAGIILMSMKLWPTLILFGLSLCFSLTDSHTSDQAGLPMPTGPTHPIRQENSPSL